MKIHIYRGEFDKIPLNAIPFYGTDTMYLYSQIEELYSNPPYIAKQGKFCNLKKLMKVDNEVPMQFPDSRILNMNCPLDEKPLDIFDMSGFGDMIVLEKEERGEGLIVNVVYDLNIDFKGFLNICNEHYKKEGYKFVAYHFEIENKKKPNIGKGEYDRVIRVGATDDYMGTRCYIKYFNKK